MTRRILTLVLFAASYAAGCDGCGEPLSPLATGTELPVGSDGEGRSLTYVGDDPLAMYTGDTALLRFTRKSESGQPVAGDAITVSVHGTVVTVTSDTFTTDSGGGIEVPIAAGTVEGQATVVARATDLDGTIDEAVAHVQVTRDPVAGIKVTIASQTRIHLVKANTRILVGSNPPPCSAILAGITAEPSPQMTAVFQTFPSTQTFAGFPADAKAVVVAEGISASGGTIARGCAETGVLPGGVDTAVTITLAQDDSVIAGDYDVLMHMALGDALPHPYDDTVELITALLADPAGYAVYVTLREIDRQTGFTSFVTRDPGGEQTYRQVSQAAAANPSSFATWSFARNQLEQVLEQQLGQTYIDVTNVGQGIRDVVTDFEVGAGFNLVATADGELAVHEQWKDVVLYWPLGCAAGDQACARLPMTLDDLNLSPVTTTYGASYAYAPLTGTAERYAVTTDPHGLNVRYGAFLVAILDQVVFPSLPANVAGDNFGEVLQNLVGCQNISASIFNDPTAQSLIAGICDGALAFAGQEIENQLISLQVDATDPSVSGLQSAGTFALVDKDEDLTTELVSDYDYAVEWNTPNDPAATADISAPITGDGLRARVLCADDGTCETGESCMPRGSYLKVAKVELGCERSKGVIDGGAACVGDGDCASGLCAPVGVNDALRCYAACDAINDCTSGQICSDTGGALDLDGVLNGLGSVAVRGCAAP